jgi:2-polyprenylphenol 6-hydroxylase
MVGAAAACALGLAGVRVALLDRANPERQWPDGPIDNRVSALTKASQFFLEAVGAWPGMVQRGVCPYRDMRVWDARADGELHFDCADTEFNELGHLVENRVTVAALWDVLDGLPSASCITPATVVDMVLTGQGRVLHMADGRSLTADLVIAADGRESVLRAMAGITTTGWEYHQHGLVATVSTERSHQATAWQRFLEQGPLAFLPLYNGQSSIVWTLASETAKDYLALSDADFIDKLEQASGGILGRILAVEARAAVALRFQYANSYIDERLVLCGDAAHAMHPLAGQGANAGLLDAAAIAELVIAAKQQKRPIASPHCLRKYERWRKGDNLMMMASMDVINKAYGLSAQPLMKLRSTGMNWVNQSAWLKNYFNHYAMGLRDDMPKLSQGQFRW